MTARHVIAALAVCIVVTGCQDPYDESRQPPRLTPSAADGRDEVVRAFAMGWINWDWQSVADQQRSLAGLATPVLARQLRQDGASSRDAAVLARQRPGSRGRVVVLKLSSAGRGLVVTQESTLTDGHADLGGEHYRVYLVSSRKWRGAWKVSRWEPQQ